jgi:aspartate aminotransferase
MVQIASRLHGLTSSKSSGQAAIQADLMRRGREVIDLSHGEFRVAPPAELIEALTECLARASNLYTDPIGIPTLREQLAARLTRSSGRHWESTQIAVTSGAKQALFNVVAVSLEPNDEILIPSPYWTTFPAQAQLIGARAVTVDLTPHGFAPDVQAFEAAITPATRALLLNSPNNPTGRVYTTDEWMALFALAKRHGLLVIVDECYKEYCFPRSRYISPAPLWDGAEDKLVVVDSFSKALSVTGWRIGFVAGHSKVIEAIRTIQNHTTSNPSSLIQHAICQALHRTDFGNFIESRWRALAENRTTLQQTVEYIRRDPTLAPDGGFFIYVPTAGLAGRDKRWVDVNSLCNEILEESAVLVVPGTSFGDDRGIRISFCGNAEDVTAGAQRLQAFLASRDC